MFRMWSLLFILTLLLSHEIMAQKSPYRRLVSFEWEVIEGAKTYEVELTRRLKDNNLGKPQTFKQAQAEWQGELEPGVYNMRLRARDYRGVPGDWSEVAEVHVLLENVNVLSPTQGKKISSKDSKEESVEFKWSPTPGATEYSVGIYNKDNQEVATLKTIETTARFQIAVAKEYQFRAKAINADGIESDSQTLIDFAVQGTKLETPEIKKPESGFVRQVEWKADPLARKSDILLLKLNKQLNKWEKFQSFEAVPENNIPFDASWSGGTYQVIIKSTADLRDTSEPAKLSFDVVNGNRSPAAEYTAMIRKSIDRFTGWYGVASYLITQMQFSGANPENNSTSVYSALGGTGRLGLGWALPDNQWGFLAILDLSGFTFNGKTQTFASSELNSVYKQSLGDRGEVRLQVGGFFKELPETIGNPFENSSVTENVAFIGPHFGGEYWYSLSPKLGFQANGHLYYSLLKVKTPNGQDIEPTLSTQFGLMGSYRFSNKFTGLMGYAMRIDKVGYKAQPTNSNFASPGDVNTSTITGHYLNFLAEFNF